MSTLDLSDNSKRSPAEVLAGVDLSEEALELLANHPNTSDYIRAACAEGLHYDALLAVAITLPRSYAINWASRCVEDDVDGQLAERDQRCLDLVRKWLAGPEETVRRAAMEAADANDFNGHFAWLAAAVGFSGGSLAPENLVEIPPAPDAAAVAVSACLMHLANCDPDSFAERVTTYIDRGLAMAALPGA